jgi:hypothetical protein
VANALKLRNARLNHLAPKMKFTIVNVETQSVMNLKFNVFDVRTHVTALKVMLEMLRVENA